MSHVATLHDDVMSPPAGRATGAGVYTEKLGMWVFLGSEVMFFTALIGTYIILRFAHPEMWRPPGVVLAVPITAVNTFLLICSSVTMVKAFAAVQDGHLAGLRKWLVATVLIGASFVGVQIFEYRHLIEKGFVPSEGLYGSTFYTMTGFHGFHVTIGTIMLTVILFRSVAGHFKPDHHFGFEGVAWYWHFVDVVWLGLFIFVYWL
jgi:heme/copper-type cytochrome/quinol oxidase subunit 3